MRPASFYFILFFILIIIVIIAIITISLLTPVLSGALPASSSEHTIASSSHLKYHNDRDQLDIYHREQRSSRMQCCFPTMRISICYINKLLQFVWYGAPTFPDAYDVVLLLLILFPLIYHKQRHACPQDG
jgi:hypothetical protein